MASVTDELRGLPRDARKFAKPLLERGWTVHRLRNGHLRFHHPNGQDAVTVSFSPSDHRAQANAEADIRRIERRANGPASPD